ncbi:MAG TPA: hypothetical protein VFM77_05425, partial [Terriglobales bacterium]|nr:hypothetical protein [Terriglobales bacterium]
MVSPHLRWWSEAVIEMLAFSPTVDDMHSTENGGTEQLPDNAENRPTHVPANSVPPAPRWGWEFS